MHPLVVDYQASLEEALTRLVTAEEYLLSYDESGIRNGSSGGNGVDRVSMDPNQQHEDEDGEEEDVLMHQDVETVKSRFHAHEQLMNELTEYESKITEILNEGKVLMESNYCSNEEKKGIESQRSLLATRWDRLQQKSSVKQSQLHEALMLLQQKQIDNLKAWLISAEDRISNFTDVGPDLQSVYRQLEEYEALKDEVAQQQDTVNSLSNVVVIIDGADYDGENMSNDLEDQLNALSEKWSHVCRFIEERGRTLDIVSRNWKMLNEEEVKFNRWITELDRRLSEMESNVSKAGASSSLVTESIQRLQHLEQEVGQQHVHYSMIVEEGQKLLDNLEKTSESWTEVNGKLERLTDVWDLAVQRMENLGLALTKAAATASRSQKQEAKSPHNHNSNPKNAVSSGVKKIKLDSANVKEWQRELENICTWLGRIEDDLGLDDEENGAVVWEELAVEEQQILLEDTETAVEEKRNRVDSLIDQGKTLITSLKAYGENVKKLEDIVEAVDERWALVKEELDRKKIKIRTTGELSRMSSEADAMKRALHSHQKWLQNAEVSVEKVHDLEKIEEQSRVRNRTMEMQKKKVDKMREEIEDMLDDLPQLNDDESLKDIKYFIGFWESINDRNNMLQKKIRDKSREIKRQSMKAAGIEMPLHVAGAKADDDKKNDEEDQLNRGDEEEIKEEDERIKERLGETEDEKAEKIADARDSVEYDTVPDAASADVVDTTNSDLPSHNSTASRKSSAGSSGATDFPVHENKGSRSGFSDRRSSSSSESESRKDEKAPARESKWSEKYPLEAVASLEMESCEAAFAAKKSIRPSSLDTRTKPAVPPKTYKSPVTSPKTTPTSPIYDTVPSSTPTPVSHMPPLWSHSADAHAKVRVSEERLSEILLRANGMREDIADVFRRLKNSKELNGKDYENFGKQEPLLKQIKESCVDGLKPRVEKLMTEREGLIDSLDPGHQVNRVLETVWNEWMSLRELFMQRHRRWWRSRELLQQFETALTDVNVWLDTTEKSLASSRLPSGELDIKSAQQQQDSLISQFSIHIPIDGSVCVLSRLVISQCATGYGDLLREQLQTVNQRRDAIVRELAWRRERLQSDGRNSDIMSRWTELTAWLDRVEASLDRSRGGITTTDAAKDSLEQLRNFEQEMCAQWLNMMTVHLASSLLRSDEVHRIDNQFKKMIHALPDRIFLIERYLSTVKIVSEKLEQEIEWTDGRILEFEVGGSSLHKPSIDNMSVHEITYEQLVVMLEEVESDAISLGHKTPPELSAEMRKLESLRIQLLKQTRLSAYRSSLNNLTQTSQTSQALPQYTEYDVPRSPLRSPQKEHILSRNPQQNGIAEKHVELLSQDVVDAPVVNGDDEKQYDEVDRGLSPESGHQSQSGPDTISNVTEDQQLELILPESDEHEEIAQAIRRLNSLPRQNGATKLQDRSSDSVEQLKLLLEPLMASLCEFNEVRFSAYRTALKLRRVQKQLSLDQVPIDDLISIFNRQDLQNQNDETIGVTTMTSCLQDMLRVENSDSDVSDVAVNLCLSWLLNLYNTSGNSGIIPVLSFKVGLVALCKATLIDKYNFLFSLVADKGEADARKVGLLMHNLIQLPQLLGEVSSFGGSNIEPSVRSCFERAGVLRDKIVCKDFLNWLEREPQSIVWLPVMHRLAAAESCRHRVKCNICKTHPLVGLRYRCLRCFNFDVCQSCFLSGRFGLKHKVGHPMQEYCSETSPGEDVKDLSRIIRNKFKSKNYFQKHPKMGYLPVQSALEPGDDSESLTTTTVTTTPAECVTPNVQASRSLAQFIAALDLEQVYELEATIQDLEEENRLLVAIRRPESMSHVIERPILT